MPADWRGRSSSSPAFAASPAGEAAQRGNQAAASRPLVVVRSLGLSQGEAFDVQVIGGDGNAPPVIGDGVVVEPLRRSALAQAQRELQRLAGNRLTNTPAIKAEGYCLSFALSPPSQGMLFRIASQEMQERFKPVASVLKAADLLNSAGQLRPDIDPRTYLETIKQYAAWTKIENWDQRGFAAAWLDRTKKTAAAMKRQWTPAMDQAILSAAPGRWNDIQAILTESSVIDR
jgi:hypothetical protein